MKKLGFGIIGTGAVVRAYVDSLSEIPDAKLVGLYSATPEGAERARSTFNCSATSDLEAFLADPAIDVICVCNESGRHGQAIIQAAHAGKHVLSEKPLEITTQKIDKVIETCQAAGVILGCSFQNRFNPAYMALERAVRGSHLGKLLLGNAHIHWYRPPEYYLQRQWRGTRDLDGGAALINQGIHTIDLLLNLLGPVNSVSGHVRTRVHAIEGEDVAAAQLVFDNGALGTISGGTALYPGYPERLEVFGEDGSVILEGGKILHWQVKGMPKPQFGPEIDGPGGASSPMAIGHTNHKKLLEDFIGAVRENRSPAVDGWAARPSVAVIEAIYRASSEGRIVQPD